MRSLERWLLLDPEHRRATIQRSITLGYWLVRLEVGEHGHGVCKYFGKSKRIVSAITLAVGAAEAELEQNEER